MRSKSKRPARPIAPTRLAIELEDLRRRVAPLVPDMDPGDLLLILENVLRGPGSGRALFLRRDRPGVYVF